MNTQPQFDLVDEPWIPVLVGDRVREVSLRDALTNAHNYRGLDTSEPLEAVAILRQVLLPVVIDACGAPRTEAEWGARWSAQPLDVGAINGYLDAHKERFDLFHPVAPFAQVADLAATNGETKSVSVLVAHDPTGNNVPLFGTRTAAMPRSLTPAQAVRVLLATHCFDTAGIKSGAVGDPHVKAGKTSNPVAPLGQMGVCIPVGSSMHSTLILNTPILPQGLDPGDRPHWRAPSHTAEWTSRAALGLLDLLTFQSRRIRLIPDSPPDVVPATNDSRSEERQVTVSKVVLCAGDRLVPLPDYEPHTQWKRVDKPDANGPARRPIRFQAGRAAWRGLSSMVARNPNNDGAQTSVLLSQVDHLRATGHLPLTFRMEVQVTGVAYGNQSAVVEDVISDSVPLPVSALMDDSEVHSFLLDLVDQSEQLRKAANDLDDTLRRASGGDAIPRDKSQRLGDVLIDRLGSLVNRFLIGLQRSPDMVDEAELAWRSAARSSAMEVAEQGLDACPPTAFLGRPGRKVKYPDRPSDAEARFRAAVNTIVPRLDAPHLEGANT